MNGLGNAGERDEFVLALKPRHSSRDGEPDGSFADGEGCPGIRLGRENAEPDRFDDGLELGSTRKSVASLPTTQMAPSPKATPIGGRPSRTRPVKWPVVGSSFHNVLVR